MKSLLILGEYHNSDVNKNILRLQRYSKLEKLNPRLFNYSDLSKGKLPRFPKETSEIIVMPFFPFEFWSRECEIPEDTCVYGTSNKSYDLFKEFLQESKIRLNSLLKNELRYVIDLEKASVDRDKIKTHELLEVFKIPTTRCLPKNFQIILEEASIRGVFVKARYGAMGKGITYLSPTGWFTNYRVGRKSSIENWPEENNWQFTEITRNEDFLRRLLDLEVIVEEEVVTPQLRRGQKFDVRAYSVYGTVPHMFIRENEQKKFITNFSQGGTMDHKFRKILPAKSISRIELHTQETAKAFNSNFLGADVIFDRDLQTPKVLEVQTFTGFPKIRQFNLTQYLARQIKEVA